MKGFPKKKFNVFNAIYDRKLNNLPSGRSDDDVLKSAQSEYHGLNKIKVFPNERVWDILKTTRNGCVS